MRLVPATTPDTSPQPTARTPANEDGSIKFTLITIVIAFVLTLVFRAFVAEAFLIPTGSMAPTLLGEHLRSRSFQTGYDWAANAANVRALPRDSRAIVNDPSSGLRIDTPVDGPRAGDRIFVLKFLGAVFAPKRWDVVVFKNPELPEENYIKRLVGLPGEQVLLLDGDVFTKASADASSAWVIARKPARLQESLWRPIYSSQWAALDDEHLGEPWIGPWTGVGFERVGREYRASGAAEMSLEWDAERFPITDAEPYNDTPRLRTGDDDFDDAGPLRFGAYPIGDVRLSVTVHAKTDVRVRGVIEAPGRTYAGEAVRDGAGALVLRILRRSDDDASWLSIAEKRFKDRESLLPGVPTRVSLAHADQSVELAVGDRRRVRVVYDWDARERLARATTLDTERVTTLFDGRADEEDESFVSLVDPDIYPATRVRWELHAAQGGPIHATLARVGLERDIRYRPAFDEQGAPARATHPARTARLAQGQYFVLGDNSASSRDGRLWEEPNDWVKAAGDTPSGVITDDLLIGKAFFVYFPAPLPANVFGQRHAIVPDFGRMRFIR